MSETIHAILRPIASLKLTVVLMALSVLLIFAGTLAQVNNGIYHVQKYYFHTVWVWSGEPFQSMPLMPGGYLLGVLLLANLLAAHAVRFTLSWRRLGIVILHAGLVFLLVGEFGTSLYQVDTQMRIREGGSTNFAYDVHEAELAFIDSSSSDKTDRVISVPQSLLENRGVIVLPEAPFRVRVDRWYANSEIKALSELPPGARPMANQGFGREALPVELPLTPGTSNRIDSPSAIVTIETRDGVPIGTWLVASQVATEQPVVVGGGMWLMDLRPRRYYKPYTLHLKDFKHERYEGTDKPKKFESEVLLVDPSRGETGRIERIYMNHPLRYNNETLYQASFAENDTVSILQVVHNPVWFVPYLSSFLVGLGMLIHFGIVLWRFARRSGGKLAAVPPLPIEDRKGAAR